MDARIELTLPARTDFFYLVRLHVAAVASRIDMTLEDVEDLHLAAEELCMSLLSLSPSAPDRLAVEIAWDPTVIAITCRLIGEADLGRPTGAWTNEGFPELLSTRILDALVDEHGVTMDGDQPTTWLRKRRERPLPGP
jgi:serine/threonine-protein kinase RsbW